MEKDRGPMRSCLTDQRSWFRREMKKIAAERGCSEDEAHRILAARIAENRRKRDASGAP